MSADEIVTQAAQLITGGDFAGAMGVFESYIDSNPDDPAGCHGWAEAALFDIKKMGTSMTRGMIELTKVKSMHISVERLVWLRKMQTTMLHMPTLW